MSVLAARRSTPAAAAVGVAGVAVLGLGVGVLTSYGQTYLGGAVCGAGGHLARHGPPDARGFGPAALGAAFIAEGLWTYLHALHRPVTAVLWLAIGAGIAVAGLRGRRDWGWLAVTVPAGLLAEVIVTQIYL